MLNATHYKKIKWKALYHHKKVGLKTRVLHSVEYVIITVQQCGILFTKILRKFN